MSDKTLYIVDAHAHIYASYYAIRAMSSPGGEPTNAIYGFTGTLLAILRQRKPTCLAVVFDAPGGSFRNDVYPDYKATRQPMPEDMPGQIDRIHQVLAALRIAELTVPGVEADDVIATLARHGRRKGLKVFICSKDKDLEQMIGEGVVLFDARADRMAVIDGPALAKDKGYRADQAADILALTGDSSDNVPGVPGVGPKTAAKLLAQFDTLDNLLAHIDQVPGKTGQNIKDSLANIELARKLVKLKEDVKLPVSLDDLKVAQPDPELAGPLFTELGFARFAEQLQLPHQTDTLFPAEPETAQPKTGAAKDKSGLESAADCEYSCIDTEAKLAELAERLALLDQFAVDTETTSLDAIRCELVGISFAWQDRRACYVPVQSPGGGGFGLPLAHVVEKLGPVLADDKIAKVGHHMKFDYQALRSAGMTMANLAFDTMIASYLLDPERTDHRLDSLAEGVLRHRAIPITDLIGKGKKQISMRDVPVERVSVYASEDADVTWRLHKALKPTLKEQGLLDLLGQLEMPLVAVLAEMERNGVAIDAALLAKMTGKMDEQAGELAERIHRAAGQKFNIDSTRQLADVLFKKLALPAGKITKGGSLSTDVEVLEQLASKHEVPKLVLEYRQLVKLKSTYVEALPRMVNPDTGLIHPDFTQTRTATGRLACQEPNLQNIPVRTAVGRQIRAAFVPRSPGHVLLTADYSQVELRILAHLSRDPALMEAFARDQDIHAFVAAQVFEVPIGKVTAEQRRKAKAVNFGIIYGQTPFGLARSIGISQSEAAEFIEAYFKRYATVRKFLDRCIQQARDHGYATTMLGRRRPIPEINSRNASRRALAERTAVNTVTQGSAADLIKQAMVNIDRRIRREKRPILMLIQVHDELVFELAAKQVQADSEMIRREMAGALKLDVPLKVDVAWGKSWLEAK